MASVLYCCGGKVKSISFFLLLLACLNFQLTRRDYVGKLTFTNRNYTFSNFTLENFD